METSGGALARASTGPSAVVFSFGSAFITCGFAGEAQPRHIVSIDFSAKGTNRDGLAKVVYSLYFDYLQTNPHDRPAVVCTNLLSPISLHETLAWVFFAYLQVPSVLFLTNEAIATFPLRLQTSLVIDVGKSEVYEGALQTHALRTALLAGDAIEDRLLKLISESSQFTENEGLSLKVIRDIKIRLSSVDGTSSQKMEGSKMRYAYPVTTSKSLLLDVDLLSDATEVLFEENEEEESLGTLVLDALKACSCDSRCPLAQNILITGGTAMLRGIETKLLALLETLVLTPRYDMFKGLSGQFSCVESPFAVNLLSWVGGSIIGCVEHKEAIPLQLYMEKKLIPHDWTRIMDSKEKSKGIKGPFALTPSPINSSASSLLANKMNK